MNPSGETAPIALPQWYACVTPDRGRVEVGASEPAGETVRVGPLTVFKPQQGSDVAAFGAAGDCAVVFDGYLFDRDDLCEQLGLAGGVGAARLVATAYERWGCEIFQKLDGCYLIAVWDAATRQVLLGHDAVGRHPAFYAIEDGTLWFGSNVLALSSSGRVPKRPSRLSLALGVLGHWPDAGQTFFERIRRVRPGHYLKVTSGRAAEHKYWDSIPDDDEPWLPEEQVIAEFEPALLRAVSRCMALGPQGIMLSGGVDSVTVAALAADYSARHGTPPIAAVSGRTDGELAGEERMQSSVATALQMRHLVSTTSEWTKGRDDVSLSLEITGQLPGPSRIYWVGTYTSFYRQTAGQGLRVLLTGSGGDNWLAVADPHAADLMRGLRLVQLYQFVQTALATGGLSLQVAARRILWTGGIRPLVDTLATQLVPGPKLRYHRRRWYENLPPWLCPDETLREQLVSSLLGRRMPGLCKAGRAPRSYYRHSVRSDNPYLHHEFETAFHMESACGLRLLSPYHDRELVRFFNRIAPKVLLHGNRYKGLLRPVVGKRLPGLGFENQKKAYSPDWESRHLRDLRAPIARLWPGERFEALGALGVVDPASVLNESDRIATYGFTSLVRLFGLMSAERWIRVHAGA